MCELLRGFYFFVVVLFLIVLLIDLMLLSVKERVIISREFSGYFYM